MFERVSEWDIRKNKIIYRLFFFFLFSCRVSRVRLTKVKQTFERRRRRFKIDIFETVISLLLPTHLLSFWFCRVMKSEQNCARQEKKNSLLEQLQIFNIKLQSAKTFPKITFILYTHLVTEHTRWRNLQRSECFSVNRRD